MKIITAEVNEEVAEVRKHFADLIVFMLRKTIAEFSEDASNIWNNPVIAGIYKHTLTFINHPEWKIKNSGLYIVKHFIETFGSKTYKRFAKDEILNHVANALAVVKEDVDQFRALIQKDKDLKKDYLNKTWNNFYVENPNFDRLEVKKYYVNNLLEIYQLILANNSSKITTIPDVLANIEHVTGHPIADISFRLLKIFDAILTHETAAVSEDQASLGRMLMFIFNVMKRRSFDLESEGFSAIAVKLLAICSESQSQFIDAAFKIMNKIARKSLVK